MLYNSGVVAAWSCKGCQFKLSCFVCWSKTKQKKSPTKRPSQIWNDTVVSSFFFVENFTVINPNVNSLLFKTNQFLTVILFCLFVCFTCHRDLLLLAKKRHPVTDSRLRRLHIRNNSPWKHQTPAIWHAVGCAPWGSGNWFIWAPRGRDHTRMDDWEPVSRWISQA